MASPIGHTLGGLTIYLLAGREARGPLFPAAATAGVVLAANAPDLDFLPGLLVGNASRWHHGFTHGVLFAILVSSCVLVAGMLKKDAGKAAWRASLLIGGILLLHLALDLVTEDTFSPIGLQVFWPFSRAYMLAPWALLDSVPRGAPSPELLGRWARLALKEGFLLGIPFIAALVWRLREQRSSVSQAV